MYSVPHSVMKTERTGRVCKGDSNGFNIQDSGVIYWTGIQAFLIQQKLQVQYCIYWHTLACETNTGVTKRLILITVITVM